jgi:hypothetical protein
VQRHRIIGIGACSLGKAMGDFGLGRAEDDASLALASACACRLIASCSAAGILTSRISTDLTSIPHATVLASIVARKVSSIALRFDSKSAKSLAPIISRREVCAAQAIASP